MFMLFYEKKNRCFFRMIEKAKMQIVLMSKRIIRVVTNVL